MATIEFRAKVEQIYTMEGEPAFKRIKVPALTRKHCDMAAFRKHPRFGGLANSDLFPGVLARIRREKLGEYIRMDRVPDTVKVDDSGFLAVVRVDV